MLATEKHSRMMLFTCSLPPNTDKKTDSKSSLKSSNLCPVFSKTFKIYNTKTKSSGLYDTGDLH